MQLRKSASTGKKTAVHSFEKHLYFGEQQQPAAV